MKGGNYCVKCGEYFCHCKECPFCDFYDPEMGNIRNHIKTTHLEEITN